MSKTGFKLNDVPHLVDPKKTGHYVLEQEHPYQYSPFGMV